MSECSVRGRVVEEVVLLSSEQERLARPPLPREWSAFTTGSLLKLIPLEQFCSLDEGMFSCGRGCYPLPRRRW